MLDSLEQLLLAALAEDTGQEDITTLATVAADARCEARLYAKESGVLSGITVFQRVFELVHQRSHGGGGRMEEWNARFDGERFEKGELIATFNGQARAVLTGERVALNFLQHLSGVATLTAAFCAELEGTQTRIVDTRKTTPLLRKLERAAVVHGGGANHRYNLATGVLIKENHIAAAGGLTTAVHRARAAAPHLMKIEVEVRDLIEFDEALHAGADVILLDNMPIVDMAEAVRRAEGRNLVLEASGNMSLDRVRDVAETGVHLISVGALTHSPRAIDFSLLVKG